MTMEQGAIALTTSVGIGLLLLLYVLFRRLLLEIFRDQLFHLRESWFNLALDPESTLEFDDSVYRSVEHSLCSMLRFAHRISFAFILWLKVGERIRNVEFDISEVDVIGQRIKDIADEYTRNQALMIWKRIPVAIHIYLVITSMPFFLWNAVLFLTITWGHAPNISRQKVRSARMKMVEKNEPVLEKIEQSAYQELPV